MQAASDDISLHCPMLPQPLLLLQRLLHVPLLQLQQPQLLLRKQDPQPPQNDGRAQGTALCL